MLGIAKSLRNGVNGCIPVLQVCRHPPPPSPFIEVGELENPQNPLALAVGCSEGSHEAVKRQSLFRH